MTVLISIRPEEGTEPRANGVRQCVRHKDCSQPSSWSPALSFRRSPVTPKIESLTRNKPFVKGMWRRECAHGFNLKSSACVSNVKLPTTPQLWLSGLGALYFSRNLYDANFKTRSAFHDSSDGPASGLSEMTLMTRRLRTPLWGGSGRFVRKKQSRICAGAGSIATGSETLASLNAVRCVAYQEPCALGAFQWFLHQSIGQLHLERQVGRAKHRHHTCKLPSRCQSVSI